MVVTVRLHTALRRDGTGGPIDRLTLDLPRGATVQAILDALGMEMQDEAVLLVVNGRTAEGGTVLNEGDEVRLVPAIAGGP